VQNLTNVDQAIHELSCFQTRSPSEKLFSRKTAKLLRYNFSLKEDIPV